MKRDWALIYKILRYTRENENGPLEAPDFDGYSKSQVAYHMELCEQATFIKLTVANEPAGMRPGMIWGLTWEGHNQLEAHTDD